MNLFWLLLLVSSWLANQWDLTIWNFCDSAHSLLCEIELSLGYYDFLFFSSTTHYRSWRLFPLILEFPGSVLNSLSSHCRCFLHQQILPIYHFNDSEVNIPNQSSSPSSDSVNISTWMSHSQDKINHHLPAPCVSSHWRQPPCFLPPISSIHSLSLLITLLCVRNLSTN